jgi:hypothetical protein
MRWTASAGGGTAAGGGLVRRLRNANMVGSEINTTTIFFRGQVHPEKSGGPKAILPAF